MTDSAAPAAPKRDPSREIVMQPTTGWVHLFVFLLLMIGLPALAIYFETDTPGVIVPLILTEIALIICLCGFFIVEPNMSRVLVLFGKYIGTVREDGFYWVNPFTSKRKVSLKAQNSASDTIKVNDLAGNPIEIGAVLVWQVSDTAQAEFDVEDHFTYVNVQLEAAVRQLAQNHPYDENSGPSDVPNLRGDTSEVSEKLQDMIQERLAMAGIAVVEARLSELAYAPEIASAMLQRQQAEAVVAAREKIVEGAVSMVEQALTDLSKREVVELDPERRATLVGNLLVVLSGSAPATPVLNTGSLYN